MFEIGTDDKFRLYMTVIYKIYIYMYIYSYISYLINIVSSTGPLQRDFFVL